MRNKFWALGLVSLACLGLAVAEADAFFHHRRGCGLRCHAFTTHITCRPYNAFTPICWGNLTCDGCCPNPCGVASGCGIPGMGGMGCGMGYGMGNWGGWSPWDSYASGYPSCEGGNCPGTITTPAPSATPGQPNFTPPPPAINQTMYGYPRGYGYYGVQPVGYYSGYYPGYYPYQYPQGYNYGYGYGYGYNPAAYYGYGYGAQR
jgi:hypothetical protein